MKLNPFKLDQWLSKYMSIEFDLGASTGPHWTVRELLDLAGDDALQKILDTELVYTHPEGERHLREAIAEMQGVSADEIQIMTGAAEALFVLFFLAAEPDANVIMPFPCFPPTIELPRSLGIDVRTYHVRRENEFQIDPDEIKQLVDTNTKIILINVPHNPTGATIDDDILQDLHDYAAERQIQFMVDEVYHPIYHGVTRSSAAHLPHATVLGDFSKAFSLSGLRVGWIVERDRKRIADYCDARSYFTISNTPIGELMATIAVQHRDTIFERVRQVASENLVLLDRFFADHSNKLAWIRPASGMTGFPWLTSGEDARPFCEQLTQRGVLLAPGDCYDMPSHFRIGFGTTDQGYKDALARFDNFLRS